MKMFYESSGSNTFLCCSLEEQDIMDSFYYGMLSNNKIENVIPVLYSVENNEKFLRYNISSKISLSEYFSGIVSKKRVINIFYSIVNALIEAEEYMIDPKLFVLNQDYIFVDVTNLNAAIICFPITNYDNKTSMVDFFKNIMFTLAFDQTENNDYVAKILSYINSTSNFSLSEFKKILIEILENTYTLNRKTQDNSKDFQKKDAKLKQTDKNEEKKQKNIIPENIQNKKIIENKKTNFSDIPDSEEKNVNKKDISNDSKAKKMSFLHLMSNFSKENLEIYKSQKSSSDAPQQQMKKSDKMSKSSFAVPGKNEKFAIPNKNDKAIQKSDDSHTEINNVRHINHNDKSQTINNKAENKTEKRNTFNSKMNFGATVYFDENKLNSTVMINENMISENDLTDFSPHIIRKKTQEDVDITISPFKIGKEPTFVDYCITGNPAISGCHAFIICDNDTYYIKDTNSTNHVYVNGQRIQSNTLVPITHNDVIKLANEDFDFKLY